MNRYYYLVFWMHLLVFWMHLFAMPCCAMLNPGAFGNFGSPQRPAESQPLETEKEHPYITEGTSIGYEEPELTGVYAKNVITADDEPPAYTREQVPQFPPHMAPEEVKQSMESSAPIDLEELLITPQTPVQIAPSVQQIPTPVTSSSSAPIESQPSTPNLRPSAVSPTAPSTPISPPPARPMAPSKAHESITKANSKLSSALRRLDAIKGYYKEINQEERKAIKKKTENMWQKEYQSDLTKFAQRIGQVKNELGDRADKAKLAPFNTFIDLVNKLSQAIKKL